MINPKCSYSIGDDKRRLDGVAVLLGQFTKELDDKEIPHENESALRKKLRRRANVKTSATQYFLDKKKEGKKITRENGSGHSCIIIPRSDVPQEFFDIVEAKVEGTCYTHAHTLTHTPPYFICTQMKMR